MNIYCIRFSIEYKMPMSEVRRCLTIKFTLFLMMAGVALAQKPDTNTVIGPINANGGGAAEFRKYFSQCKTQTAEFDECIMKAINNARSYFTTGVPELGIPPFDPFFATEVRQSKRARLLGYKLSVHNVTESQWRLSEIKKFKTDFLTNTIKFTHYFPEKYLEGYYEVENTLLRPGVTTVGQFNMTLYDYIQIMTVSKPTNSNQIKVSVQIQEIGNMSLHISNLSRGRVLVENVLDRIINASWRIGFPIVKPLINDLVSVAFTKIWNDIFNNFDFNLILP
ncbi:Haemolymph juvenile hormone binding [Cinara cedri]|uniref:Haemolymph juvenile hormone binding n=1 Tax=Cinara cedri TaxID=506608 RepID=A0A5E4MS69_9HEMI|nr:Haemolymph juvenile hormone binding [Cinara cedri]